MTSASPKHEHELEHAIALHRQGRISEAEPIYRRLCEEQPELAEPWHLSGVIELQKANPSAAVPLLRQALARTPAHEKCRTNLGAALYQLQRWDEAESALREVLRVNPQSTDARYNHANVLMAQNRAEDAMAAFDKVLRLAPRHVKALANAGILHLDHHMNAEAEDYLQRALAIAPDDFVSLLNLARTLERLNKLDEAQDCAAKALALQPDLPAANLFAAKIDYRQKRHQQALDKLQRAIDTSTETTVLTDALYTLGLACDALERTDEAFATFTQANALEREQTLSNAVAPERYRARIQAAQERLQSATITHTETADAAQPVFFVGFPRSGTTLLEQMLVAHPGVVTTNEVSPLAEVARNILQGPLPHTLDAQAWATHRAHFWDAARASTRSSVGDAEDRLLIDKMPLNIEFLDVAARLFPNAKVLMAIRDPRDVCLSCFMQHFERSHALANFQSLDDTVELYGAVMDLWCKQRDRLPLAWLEYRYEDLVDDMDTTLNAVLNFLGLEWTDDIRAYREQAQSRHIITPSYRAVGEQVYSRAVGRWKRYEKPLSPQTQRLAPYIQRFGYDQ